MRRFRHSAHSTSTRAALREACEKRAAQRADGDSSPAAVVTGGAHAQLANRSDPARQCPHVARPPKCRASFASTVNAYDAWHARRFARLRDVQDFPLGAEGAGVVLACGADVTSVQPGQAVACSSATFSEHTVLQSRQCYPVDAATAEVAATALSGVFACAVMCETGQVQKGTRVLITAAAGAHLQLCQSLCVSIIPPLCSGHA